MFALANAVKGARENIEQTKAQVSQTTKRKDTKSDYMYKDLREEVFHPSFLTDDVSTFMNIVCRKCWDYMDNLQRTGYLFYKNMGSKSLIRGDLLESSYEEFAVDVRNMFRSFVAQCENVWLHMIHGFLPVLGKVKTSLKIYFKRRIREYSQNVISTLEGYDVQFTNRCNSNSCHMLSELQSLDDKLLPLHGYPRNSHLLKSLEDEVVVKTAELELNWEVFMKDCKNKLKSIHKLSTSESEDYQALKCLYIKCKDAVFHEKLGIGLLQFIDNIFDKRSYVKRMDKETSKIADGEALLHEVTIMCNIGAGKLPSAEKCELKLHHIREGLENAEKYITEIKQMIRRETAAIPLESIAIKEDWMELIEPKIGLLSGSEEFDEESEVEMKKVKSVYREIKRFVRSKTNFHREVIFEWLDRWKRNVEKITKLYSVEYSHVDDPSEE